MEPENIEPITIDAEPLTQRCLQLEDQLKRSLADYQNLLRRTNAEREQMRSAGIEFTVRALFATLDNFFYASKAASASTDPSIMIYTQMVKSLESIGVYLIQPSVGEQFDASMHDAVVQIPSAEHGSGSIVELLCTGYRLADKVLKPATVAVAAAIPDTQENESCE